MRKAEITRKTNETGITLSVNLDGKGLSSCDTGCGFLNHMLTLFARHGALDLEVSCVGDTEVDFHHTTEDIAICLGKCVKAALGDMRGIKRYGDIILPMDEALIMCAVDISGRGGFYTDLSIPAYKVGDFDTELCEEFMRAFARESGITVHIKQLSGSNSHHIIEGVFKALARCIGKACTIDKRFKGTVPSTKGVI